MKNTYKIIACIAIVMGITISCKKQLEISPQTASTELNTFKAIKNGLNGCYDGFQSDRYYNNPASSGSGSGWSALPDLMGDDMIESFQSLGNWRSMSEMSYASDNAAVQEVFKQPYEIIARANNLLQSLSPYIANEDTKDEALLIKAQALVIRAHAHFDLMRYFAPDFGRNSTSLGVSYVTKFDPINPLSNLPARNTVKEDYDKIFNDFQEALILFRQLDDNTDNESRYFIDSTVVYAMRARVNYYASQWSNASMDASVVINLRPIANATDYIKMYTIEGQTDPPSEVIWAIPVDNALRPGGATSGTRPAYRISTPLSDIITFLGGAYVDPVVINFSAPNSTGFKRRRLQKYADLKTFKVFRTGEMALIKAEAEQNLGNDAIALAILNDLRTNRDIATGLETGQSLLDAITLLRRVELLGEGHRWFDIKRTTKTINRTECGSAGNSLSNTCSVESTSRAWTFPIPFNDMLVSPNLVQNPGY